MPADSTPMLPMKLIPPISTTLLRVPRNQTRGSRADPDEIVTVMIEIAAIGAVERGRMIFVKIPHSEAPSSRAASSRSSGRLVLFCRITKMPERILSGRVDGSTAR